MKKRILRSTMLILACGLIYVTMKSDSSGQWNSAKTGCGASGSCHGPASTGTTVNITGLPATLTAGGVYTLTVTVQNISKMFAGFNCTADVGIFSIIDPSSTQVNGLQTEVTHKAPKVAAGGTGGVVSFQVKYTAPSSFPSGSVNFYVAGNAVNALNNTSGDEWAIKTINVPTPAPNSTTEMQQVKTSLAPSAATDFTVLHGSAISTVQVYSLNGKLMQTHNVAETSTYTINVQTLPAGLYIVKGVDGGKAFTARFSKL